MIYLENINKPSESEQKVAQESCRALAATLKGLQVKNPEIEIESTQGKIKIPRAALEMLVDILKATSQGKPITIIPVDTEMTTGAAADLLGCSRPYVVKLLEQGEIPFTKVGRHRRLKFEDVMAYKKRMKARQKELIIQIMQADEKAGLYSQPTI